jgi:transposase
MGRVCVIRKSEAAIKLAHEKIRKEASKKSRTTKPETLEYAKYIILFTTFPESEFSPSEVLEWYRVRWQVELVFKRFKSLAQLGHLPKQDDESAKAWLYGKLLVALIVEKLVEHASSVSPWGYVLEELKTPQRLERV